MGVTGAYMRTLPVVTGRLTSETQLCPKCPSNRLRITLRIDFETTVSRAFRWRQPMEEIQ